VFTSGRARMIAAAALVLSVAVVVIVVVVRSDTDRSGVRPASAWPADLTGRVLNLLATQNAEQPYRDPTADERAVAASAVAGLPTDTGGFAPLGLTTYVDTDAETGRPYALMANRTPGDRAWGSILVDLSAPVRLVIEVPHPRTDIDTELIGLALFRAAPGSVVLFAGTHRKAAGERGDVAHNADSLFQAMAEAMAERDVPQVQLHGFADLNLPSDLVVSTGNDDPNRLAERIADNLSDRDFGVCEAWRQRCGRLEGTTNVQGQAAAEIGSVFVHLEISNSVRVDEEARARVVAAVRAALPN
jgi:hypothetical protein